MSKLYKALDGFEYDVNSKLFKAGVEAASKMYLKLIKKNDGSLYYALLETVLKNDK